MGSFETTITALHGVNGVKWLHTLPDLVKRFANLWQLHDLTPYSNLSYNYVAAGWRAQQPIVLKIGLDISALRTEASALQAFNGHGMIKLLEHDYVHGGLLLQRAVPGTTLRSMFPAHDAEALAVACGLLNNIQQTTVPMQHNFPLLSDWLQVLDQEWDLPLEYLQRARALRSKLLAQSTQQILLHGDVHYDNILANEGSWLAIDPKGVIGDPIYDKIGSLIREPLAELLQQNDPKLIVQRRISYVADFFNINSNLIYEWSYIQTMMAICWCIEDKQDHANMLQFLPLIDSGLEIS